MSAERDPHTMTRRQLIRHSAWFGAAVVLTVAFLGFAADRVYLMITRRALAWRE